MNEEKTIVKSSRSYEDGLSIKNDVLNKLAPKYFNGIEVSGLNVGLLGLTLENISNITEDAFNTASVLINESFPNRSRIPEFILSHSAIFQLDNTFSTSSVCQFVVLLKQEEVLKYGEVNGNKTSLFIDKRTKISVEDKAFTLDYDIRIDALKKIVNGLNPVYNFSAQYVIDSKNSISNVNDPYLKIRKVSNDLLFLTFSAHQVERNEVTELIIDNTKINSPIVKFSFDDYLAGFDVFYKPPTSSEYTQLQKRIKFSLPIKEPFCYYKRIDEKEIELSFSTKDGYFIPEFNSEIKVIIYSTKGKDGIFESYSGTDVTVAMNSDKYEYNENLTIVAKPTSDSKGGSNDLSLDDLQALTVESFSTATELSTENDILLYFNNFSKRYSGVDLSVIKRRDDITERLYSSFIIVKNGDYIYPTNTLNLDLSVDDFDDSVVEGRYTLKPGHCFVYDGDSKDTLKMVKNTMCYDDEANNLYSQHKFVYTNPFLLSINKTPNNIGIYKTITNQNAVLDFIYSNDNSFTQFITSKININRKLGKKNEYIVSLDILPSSSLDPYIKNLNSKENNDVRLILSISDNQDKEIAYVEMLPVEIDPTDNTKVKFQCKLEVNDVISTNGLVKLKEGVKVNDEVAEMYIPINDAKFNVYICHFDGVTTSNKFTNKIPDLTNFSISNIYSTNDEKVSLITPMNMMRSSVTFYKDTTGSEPKLRVKVSLLPMIKSDVVNNIESFNIFINRLTDSYNYLSTALPLLRNNTHLDIKFYNTYGKSNNYIIGESSELIDRVNIKIKFNIHLLESADVLNIKETITEFIKNFIERLNSIGNNDLYISNLIREIETKFPSVHHLRFLGINEYDTSKQSISVKEKDINNLSKTDRRNYVPEILVVDKDNVEITFTN